MTARNMPAEQGDASDKDSIPRLQRASGQPENPFAALIPHQHISIVPSFTLERGATLHNVPVAYTTRGKLSKNGDNALVICHALSGSADVDDWWGPLMGGAGRAFDSTRFFIVCLNSLGSPYGSASPVTNKDGDSKRGRYGPKFPETTIRDDVNIHKLVLDDLGVKQIAAAVGGSMGGMMVLEYAYFGTDYVRAIVPIATSSRHSAWGISWGEAQRQSIYCDPKYEDGYYPFDDPPTTGLGAARMSALLTYRSPGSFEERFGRNAPGLSRKQAINGTQQPSRPLNEHCAVHNEGRRNFRSYQPSNDLKISTPSSVPQNDAPQPVANGNAAQYTDPQFHGATTFATPTLPTPLADRKRATIYFTAQSYLRYQAEKFVKRFDSNCYIAITQKLDTHDVSKNRVPPDSLNPVADALSQIKQPALVIGIESDGLFTFAEQQEIAAAIPDSRLRTINSPEGHDAFLLQFEQVNKHILDFFNEVLPDIMALPGHEEMDEQQGSIAMTTSSTFGEAEVGDITAW